jgi:hypothetical protein
MDASEESLVATAVLDLVVLAHVELVGIEIV